MLARHGQLTFKFRLGIFQQVDLRLMLHSCTCCKLCRIVLRCSHLVLPKVVECIALDSQFPVGFMQHLDRSFVLLYLLLHFV